MGDKTVGEAFRLPRFCTAEPAGRETRPLRISSRRIQHILNKNPIPSRRVIHQDVRHRAHQLAVLDYGRTAHG